MSFLEGEPVWGSLGLEQIDIGQVQSGLGKVNTSNVETNPGEVQTDFVNDIQNLEVTLQSQIVFSRI